MKIQIKLIRVGQYHTPSKFTSPKGEVFDVPANWDALGQFDDGDIANLRLRGLQAHDIPKVGQVATIEVSSIGKMSGIWTIKGNATLSK